MRIALLTSTSRRHAYLARRLQERHDLAVIVREQKGLDDAYAGREDADLIADHFRRLAGAEDAFFPDHAWCGVRSETITVDRGGLNTDAVFTELRRAQPEAIAVFGCGLIKAPVLGMLPANRLLNIHQGLSPYYRGSGTNFWPFHDQRPELVGVTLHTIDAGTDTGGIIAHGRPSIDPTDGLHTLGLKSVVVSAELMLDALDALAGGEELTPIPQWAGGTLYRRRDFNGEAIKRVRALEAAGFIAEWLHRRERHETAAVRLIRIER
ncbi:hypothetical protein C7U92_07050 [Bradyrhizobium sp. WBOS7]|uniref:phosphoribosylglycinamide formyltransferase 1 n=1 Tax=Bradyrhizobium betae TaxID=244734 RepID=A0AAE9NFD8_9BRAD|nr:MULTISPECIES: formyl transferase [Bradyrhizobium]MDD1569375.1 hypothetical protein [Bradyrhizobium sp. WBOS1]UUO38165.1 hypothetical protein DCK84_28660 [Bradyrhizobium sp. WBOS01]MDD1529848.1 hypothetical protein [Bradyrhizobium sp. WBOS2]MDD1576494.1 hypothetical protein [Bradyrhizobium sp. WBOS7]MDD1602335.1 hypothetical protein [Bradyrhizobium sp. WBOS16]